MLVVYSITNKINNKRYIGITSNFYERKRVHLWGMKTLKHKNTKLLNAVKKYGFENFDIEILENIEGDKLDALIRENYYINYYDSYKNGYNQSEGFESSFLQNPSEETRNKHRNYMLGNQYWLGKKHTEETKKKISAIHKGKILSKETKEKISKTRKARKEKFCGENNPFYGKTHSKETMNKIKEKTGKKVMCIETGEAFKSLSECAEKMNCDRRNIQRVCIGKYKQTKGYTFKFI